jgi:exopolyphosphatase/guanosine-5'-triphosphate,3'-diphosphate pyrophosphatase
MIRVAAVDCGTNSLRMLLADVDPDRGTLVDVERRMEIVRLGEGVDRTGRIDPEAIRRTLRVTGEYARICDRAGAQRVRFVATSATRDAQNRDEFTAGVRGLLGVQPEVISGQEEAALSFAGATRELEGTHPAPYLVVDIGGGSTEFVLGGTDGGMDVTGARSVDVGCVRLTERHLHDDPPTADQVAAASADVRSALHDAAGAVPFAGARTLVGLAGSVTTVTAHALRLDRYDAEAIHLAALSVEVALGACADLLAMTSLERARLPYMHPGRVDVIGAGALIWGMVIERVAALASAAGSPLRDVISSEHDILDGIAWSLATSAS